jgi:hypothetical protein
MDNNVRETGSKKKIYRYTREVIYILGKFVKERQRGEFF